MTLNNKGLNSNKVIYELTIEDVNSVNQDDEFNLELKEKDINFIEDRVAESIDWHSVISNALRDLKNQS